MTAAACCTMCGATSTSRPSGLPTLPTRCCGSPTSRHSGAPSTRCLARRSSSKRRSRVRSFKFADDQFPSVEHLSQIESGNNRRKPPDEHGVPGPVDAGAVLLHSGRLSGRRPLPALHHGHHHFPARHVRHLGRLQCHPPRPRPVLRVCRQGHTAPVPLPLLPAAFLLLQLHRHRPHLGPLPAGLRLWRGACPHAGCCILLGLQDAPTQHC